MEWFRKINSNVHGTTYEIPLQRLKDENLNIFLSVPVCMIRKEKFIKVSSDCYFSYGGNWYSIP